jgi:hypothetical protein
MAALATQSIRRSGLTPSYAAAAGGGDTATPGMNTFLHIKTAGTGTTVTITPVAIPGQDLVITPLAVTLGATAERMIGPIRPDLFANTSTGQAAITYSSVTTVTVGIFDMTPV